MAASRWEAGSCGWGCGIERDLARDLRRHEAPLACALADCALHTRACRLRAAHTASMRSPNEQQLPQLFAPLMGRAQTSGSNSGSSGGDTHSPLPPSASRSGLYGSSENDINTSLDLEADTPPKPINSPSKPTVSISWSSAISHALPITLMNTAQVLSQAQLVTLGTALDAPGVAAMHMLGLIVVQLAFLCASAIPRYAIATPDVTVGLLNQIAVATVFASRDIPDADKAVTSLFALAAVTLLQGVCYLTLGSLRASELVQYLPYPVVCGLLGVTALGICHAGIGVAGLHVLHGHARLETSMQDLSAAWESRPAQLLATFAFALSHMGISHLTNSGTAFLLVVPAALLLFYGGLNFNPMREAELVEKAWLFERSNKYESLLDVWWTSRDFSRVWWRYTLPDKVATSMRCIVSLMALVLKVIAVEASANIAVDLDSELRAAGAANLACAALGGCLANHSALYVGPLRRALGAASDRSVLRVPMVTLVFTAAVLAAGGVSSPMDRAPRFIIGGMLLALGLQMCVDWVWNSRKRMDRVGYTLLIAIMLIALSGLPTHALFLGLLAAVASSHRRLSKLSALRYHLTGASAHAAVSRVTHAQYFLERHGHAIHLLGLEGFLFEGSTARLLRYVLATIRNQQHEVRPRMQFLVLDMSSCQGVEPSACALLARAARMLSDRQVQLILASPQPSLLPMLIAHQVLPEPAALAARLFEEPVATAPLLASQPRVGSVLGVRRGSSFANVFASGTLASGRALQFVTLDQALEWCEDELLRRGSPPSARSSEATGGCGDGGLMAASSYRPPGGALYPSPPLPPATIGGNAPPGSVASSSDQRDVIARPVPFAPFVPSGLPQLLSFENLLPFGTQQPARAGETLCACGQTSRELYVAPPHGVTIALSLEVSNAGSGEAGSAGNSLHGGSGISGGVCRRRRCLLSCVTAASLVSRALYSACLLSLRHACATARGTRSSSSSPARASPS